VEKAFFGGSGMGTLDEMGISPVEIWGFQEKWGYDPRKLET
jgi:hypothetical protein